MTLELNSIEKSIKALASAIDAFEQAEARTDLSFIMLQTMKAGVIQHFEFTYEQCWKFIQRWIRLNKSSAEADNLRSRKDLFRAAAKYGLIMDPSIWYAYSDARNLTSHTYDEDNADSVYLSIRQFLPDAQFLLEQLIKHND